MYRFNDRNDARTDRNRLSKARLFRRRKAQFYPEEYDDIEEVWTDFYDYFEKFMPRKLLARSRMFEVEGLDADRMEVYNYSIGLRNEGYDDAAEWVMQVFDEYFY